MWDMLRDLLPVYACVRVPVYEGGAGVAIYVCINGFDCVVKVHIDQRTSTKL